jgi:hypothetical protein
MKFEVESRLDDLFGDAGDFGKEEDLSVNDSISSDETEPNSISHNETEPEFFEINEIHEEGSKMNANHPLEDLKSTVLSIDWEITDEVMNRFVSQVNDLKKEFKNNKIYLLFLQLLGSVGEYIKINRGKADPDAFKVLGSSFKAFDDIVSSNTMSNDEKKSILTDELEKFKQLKKKIASKKAAKKSAMRGQPAVPPKKPVQKPKPKPVAKEEPIELVVEKSRIISDSKEDVKEIVLNPIAVSKSTKPKDINSKDIIAEVLVEMKKFIRGEFDDLREELRLRKKRR